MSLYRCTSQKILGWQAKYWRGKDRGVNLYITLGGTDIENIVESASAESAKLRLPKASRPLRLTTSGMAL